MKQILTVYTGGTIGCAPQDGQRKLNAAIAKRAIAAHFANSDSVYAKQAADLFVDSHFPAQTLSENMTPQKWNALVAHLRTFDLSQFAGVIVLHGTDTLAYTAAMLSLLFCDTPVPILLVSGNRPPVEESGNANVNFRAAVELILGGLAPNVYVPYRNSDGTVWLHLGSTLLQCPNFSEDFRNAVPQHAVAVTDTQTAINAMRQFCEKRTPSPVLRSFTRFTDRVTLLFPHTGLRYKGLPLSGQQAVVHGTYHSDTVCVERNTATEPISPYSLVWLLERCRQAERPVFLAPCALSKEQYSSAFDAVQNGAIPLSMTTEAAYCKALLGTSCGLSRRGLIAFMKRPINNEMV
ncbi:MAG: asparaginase [Clostridia bacterium]|nr:asparaginase [Clostridia bacterium]